MNKMPKKEGGKRWKFGRKTQRIRRLREILMLRKKIFNTAAYSLHSPEAAANEAKIAHAAHNSKIASYVLEFGLGITGPKIRKDVCAVFLRAEKKPFEKIEKAVLSEEMMHDSVHDARADQMQALQRSKIEQILGKKAGKDFWERYIELRSAKIGRKHL